LRIGASKRSEARGASWEISMQDEIFAFMGDPLAYQAGVDEVTRIDTHGAVIFLAGDYAYKIKRAVKLSYLDYSTLEKRREMCEREFQINRVTAPEIYFAVLPITRTPGRKLMLGGTGRPIEWAVKMKRFRQKDLLSNIVLSNELSNGLTDELISRLAEMIAKYHQSSPPVRNGQQLSAVQKLKQIVGSLEISFQTPQAKLGGNFAALYHSKLESVINQHSDLLIARSRSGYVRRCHGDMHLENIVFMDAQPTLFDAIEFDDEIAEIDILYDLAFLLMDLWFHGLHNHANRLLNDYLRSYDDEQNLNGLALVPLFISLRAAVRAMVGIDLLPHIMGKTKELKFAEIHDYLQLANRALQQHKPSLILIGGLSGTGKSTIGRAISSIVPPIPGAVHLRSDVERKAMFGKPPHVHLPEECYTESYSDEVYKILQRKAAQVLDSGHPVIVDAVFLSQMHRTMFESLADGRAIDLKTIWLHAPDEELLTRVDARRNDASDAGSAVVKSQLNAKSAPQHWIRIDAGSEVSVVTNRVGSALNLPGFPPPGFHPKSNNLLE